jgi:hypothetical protein
VSSFERLLKRVDKIDYNRIIESFKKETIENEKKLDLEMSIVERERIKSDIKRTTNKIKKVTLSKEDYIKDALGVLNVEKIIDSKFTVDTKKRHFKKLIESSVELDNMVKEELKRNISSIVQTDYGTKGEKDIILDYNKSKSINLDESQVFQKKELFRIETDNYIYITSVGGKMDGINHVDNTVVEVKNRVNRLFKELREYEKVQLMCYLYITGYNKGILVENYKGASKEYKVDYNEEYITEIKRRLRIFCQDFINFIEKPIEEKEKYYKMSEQDKEDFILDILDKIEKDIDAMSDIECLL